MPEFLICQTGQRIVDWNCSPCTQCLNISFCNHPNAKFKFYIYRWTWSRLCDPIIPIPIMWVNACSRKNINKPWCLFYLGRRVTFGAHYVDIMRKCFWLSALGIAWRDAARLLALMKIEQQREDSASRIRKSPVILAGAPLPNFESNGTSLKLFHVRRLLTRWIRKHLRHFSKIEIDAPGQ